MEDLMRIKKTRTAYYYCSVETLLNILRNNQIYASDPLKMNDRDEQLWFTKALPPVNELKKILDDTKDKSEQLRSEKVGHNESISSECYYRYMYF